jgi:hypothetical protein
VAWKLLSLTEDYLVVLSHFRQLQELCLKTTSFYALISLSFVVTLLFSFLNAKQTFQLSKSHFGLIFTLQQIHASEHDYELASSLLGVGVDYAHISNAAYTRVLFLLSRGMVSAVTDGSYHLGCLLYLDCSNKR